MQIFIRAADAAQFSIIRIIAFGIEHLPDPLSIWLARLIVQVLLLVMPRSRSVGMRNLELIFPEKSIEERRKILNDSFQILARHLQAFCRHSNLTKTEAEQMFNYAPGQALLNQVRSSVRNGVGVLIVTMHYGSFEIVLQVHARLEGPVSVLARPFPSPLLDRWWNKRRERFGNKIFSRMGGYLEIVKHLKSGGDVMVLMDQNVRAHHAVFASFFGHPAATTKAIALAAIRTGSPIFFAVSVEVAPNRYELIFSEIPPAESFTGTLDERILAITEAIHREMEKVIRAHPEQWLWIHRRFKTRPLGEVENTYGGKGIAAR